MVIELRCGTAAPTERLSARTDGQSDAFRGQRGCALELEITDVENDFTLRLSEEEQQTEWAHARDISVKRSDMPVATFSGLCPTVELRLRLFEGTETEVVADTRGISLAYDGREGEEEGGRGLRRSSLATVMLATPVVVWGTFSVRVSSGVCKLLESMNSAAGDEAC